MNGSAAPAASTGPAGAEDAGRCRACPHPSAEHGALDARFCNATLAHGYDRGCICRPVTRRT